MGAYIYGQFKSRMWKIVIFCFVEFLKDELKVDFKCWYKYSAAYRWTSFSPQKSRQNRSRAIKYMYIQNRKKIVWMFAIIIYLYEQYG
jgi:hypothetical protein